MEDHMEDHLPDQMEDHLLEMGDHLQDQEEMRTAAELPPTKAEPPCEHARTAPHQTNGRQSTCQ